MKSFFSSRNVALCLNVLLLVACGAPSTATPVAVSPSATHTLSPSTTPTPSLNDSQDTPTALQTRPDVDKTAPTTTSPPLDTPNEQGQSTGTPDAKDEMAHIDEAEQQWHAQSISSYRILVSSMSIWHYQKHQITVRNDKAVEQSASCIPAPAEYRECEVKPFDAQDFTVPGLFARVRSYAESEYAQWTEITFDSRYGFPKMISFDDPRAIDEELIWRVEEFEVLD